MQPTAHSDKHRLLDILRSKSEQASPDTSTGSQQHHRAVSFSASGAEKPSSGLSPLRHDAVNNRADSRPKPSGHTLNPASNASNSPFSLPQGAGKNSRGRYPQNDARSSTAVSRMSKLERMDLIRARNGSVLSRGFILKTDFYPTGHALDLDISLTGAPNFRSPRQNEIFSSSLLNVYGVAQPRINGLKAVLSVLGCAPSPPQSTSSSRSITPEGETAPPDSARSQCIFFSTREEPVIYLAGRPFVLRDASDPTEALALSDRAENLEAIEGRLKADILSEAAKFGGLLLTHYEGDDESIMPTWTAVDASTVLTSKEVWDKLREDGWNVEYHRIPISPDRPIEDNYLDAYLNVIKTTDPIQTSLVFSCGMGAVRTTFAMVAASMIRRKQLIAMDIDDPLGLTSSAVSGVSTPGSRDAEAAVQLEKVSAQQDLNKSLLRLTFLLQQNLNDKEQHSQQSAIELLLSQPSLLDNLSRAVRGNYGIILSLLGCLDDGPRVKKLVDTVIDSCDHVVNLREIVLDHRLHYSVTTMGDQHRRDYLIKAGKALEKYFFLLAFGSYVEQQKDFSQTFSQWMKSRVEVWNQVVFLRKASLSVFAPVADLSVISRSGIEGRDVASLDQKHKNEVALMNGSVRVLGDEWADHVVKNRGGIILRPSTLLKSDQWRRESKRIQSSSAVRGAINFRGIPGTNIYALGQPTADAIDEVLNRVRAANPNAQQIVWLNLREEPIVYINDDPYVLRRESFSLRNMKDYGGISASRLEVLEERLKNDVRAELQTFDNKILLHTETPSGSVLPVWEEVDPTNVADLREVMGARRNKGSVGLIYVRIPITAEHPPDTSDFSDLLDLVIRTNYERTAFVLNCQLGRGRSTLASIIVLLIQQWLKHSRGHSSQKTTTSRDEGAKIHNTSKLASYQVINNLLRVIRNGVRVKQEVDLAIDQCGELMNLRDTIEQSRKAAEETSDPQLKRQHAQRGMNHLKRYFFLIIFQAYLRSTQPDTLRSYETFDDFVKNRPVFKTFEKELRTDPVNALKPLERIDVAEGFASPDEVSIIVANRTGSILSASTILKSDLFTNLQKMSLPERIPGAPNFRRLPLILPARQEDETPVPIEGHPFNNTQMVCGSGMPTIEGMRNALSRVDAGPNGANKVFWTSLREEPVIYIAGRPHVLRLLNRPLQNVEATGITTDVVESMEKALKRDVQREVQAHQGKLLLHDELEESPNNYKLTPLYESVSEDDIMTPRDVFELMISEGYHVNYARVAITDEQAPLPEALDQLVHRVETGYTQAGDLIFNCQMGRGRTTTGMAAAVLIATVISHDVTLDPIAPDESVERYDLYDGYDEAAYLNGEYKIILRLVGILSHGKLAKRLGDSAIDSVEGVQNLRKAIYDYKLKVDALGETSSPKYHQIFDVACNYLYRYGALIVLANYLIERRQMKRSESQPSFPEWLQEHREITNLLSRRSLE